MSMIEQDHEVEEVEPDEADIGQDLDGDDETLAEEEQAEAEQSEPAEPEATAQTEREIEQRYAKLDKAGTAFRKKVADLLGDDAEGLVVCELCEHVVPGYHLPVEVQQPWSEEHARLLEVLKTPSSPEYVASSALRMCTDCDGWGKVLTGSKVADKAKAVCPTCKGWGYVPPPGMQPQGTAPVGEVIVAPVGAHEAAVQDDMDAWGSPRILSDGQENPNYGKMPQYKNPELP